MKNLITVQQALADDVALGSEVTVRGWVRTRRDSKAGLSFIALNDGSSLDSLQTVVGSEHPQYRDKILHLTSGCAIAVSGHLVASQGKGQRVELQAESVEVFGWVEDPDSYPVPAKRHTFEYLRDVAHLRPRTNTFNALTRVRHALARAIHQYLNDRGFYWVNTPIITASDCEGAGELFRVSTLDFANLPRSEDQSIDFGQDFFGREAYLTVSGQLNIEAYCLALSKVYTFGPTFRAENSNTSRHLAEFWMVEPEVAFADLADNAALAEDMLKTVFHSILECCESDLTFFDRFVHKGCIARLQHVIDTPFERLSYGDAVSILEKSGRSFEFPVAWGRDLQSEHERYLTEEHVGRPVVVTDYPTRIKPFYMRVNDGEDTVAAMDVLVPGMGEIVGGSQREERLEVLDRRLEECGIRKEDYAWYRDLRRYGSVPHTGFGLGLERTLGYVTGMANVRDLIPFPRTPGNARH
jgi:asparaginyl-tRNA synthetase